MIWTSGCVYGADLWEIFTWGYMGTSLFYPFSRKSYRKGQLSNKRPKLGPTSRAELKSFAFEFQWSLEPLAM